MTSRSHIRLRLTAVIVTVVSASLIAVLVACLPPRRAAAPVAETHKAPAPEQSVPPETQPLPSAAARRPAEPPFRQLAAPPRRLEARGRLAVIIDDAGYSLEELQPFLELPGPLTVAVLPNLPHSTEAAREVLAAGKDLILHCPMEAVGEENPGPGAIRTGMSAEQIEALLDKDFASVPGAAGMNNHMGSRATADPDVMAVVIDYLKRHGKYFIDSRTTPDTVGARTALRLGVPFLQRNLFLDDERTEGAIGKYLAAGVAEARDHGYAVVIGHVQTRAVLDILRGDERQLSDQDVRLARLQEIMREQAVAYAP